MTMLPQCLLCNKTVQSKQRETKYSMLSQEGYTLKSMFSFNNTELQGF